MKVFKVSKKLMGCFFTLGLLSNDEKEALELLQLGIQEIQRIEQIFSEFLPDSIVTRINLTQKNQSIAVGKECFELVERAMSISQLTKGAFDITVSPLKALYHFKNQDFTMPTKDIRKKALQNVGFQYLRLNKASHMIHKKRDIKISLAAIGKGYASDKVKKLWKSMGVTSGYINASGDLNAFGKNAEGEFWKIGIVNPEKKEVPLFFITLENASIATSGDYEQHFMYQGEKYSHNISPFNGMPIKGIKSVTVISPSAELSDALATAVYVKGGREGVQFINELPKTHCIIINTNNEILFSNDLKYEAV